jgi:hypothetical protein
MKNNSLWCHKLFGRCQATRQNQQQQQQQHVTALMESECPKSKNFSVDYVPALVVFKS